ncbi:nucleotidyltransferase domain-containing protein [Pseudomonas donghuensis]|uniref:nucleotidyltransferase domain-containing protein n=1 Tax=Pseudomonas donghuensis TaxID=1163398 RepID=UPI00029B1A0E|nr:nucleotidyltransferase domain-containing protein [Pseudomonas donghuensis]
MNKEDRHPLPGAMREWVLDELRRVEREHDVTVLYACESGSRAWGFASTDSDFDVRFIYAPRQDWYLRVDEPRDVIERPLTDELDISGWELRKTLKLLRNSNPTLLEWLGSPLVYRAEPGAVESLQALALNFYSARAARHHYLSMAKKNHRDFLQGAQVRFKKYLHVLRSLLAVRWIDLGLGMPPTAFADLLAGTLSEPQMLAETDELLRIKRQAVEADYGPRRMLLHSFIDSELRRAETSPTLPRLRGDTQLLDDYLRDTVRRYS